MLATTDFMHTKSRLAGWAVALAIAAGLAGAGIATYAERTDKPRYMFQAIPGSGWILRGDNQTGEAILCQPKGCVRWIKAGTGNETMPVAPPTAP